MGSWIVALAPVLLLFMGLVVFVVATYNRLVQLRQGVDQAIGDIEAQHAQRHDLVPQMKRLVTRYMAHESDLLTALAEARETAPEGAHGAPGGVAQTEAALGRFFARAEAYPELRADATFVRMQQAVEDTEIHLAAARRASNAAAARYNTAVGQFPLNIVAGAFGFGTVRFTATEGRAKLVPNLDGM